MRGPAPASSDLPLPRPSAWDWVLLLLLAPALLPFLAIQFVVGFLLAPPMPPADTSQPPAPAPRRRVRRRKVEPIAVEAVEPIAESVEAEPAAVSSRAPLVAFPVEGSAPYGGFAGAAPYRFRGG
jgi:hypothetical protein